jgi:hypothetical protein
LRASGIVDSYPCARKKRKDGARAIAVRQALERETLHPIWPVKRNPIVSILSQVRACIRVCATIAAEIACWNWLARGGQKWVISYSHGI